MKEIILATVGIIGAIAFISIVLYPISNATEQDILTMDCKSLHKEVVHNDTWWESDQWIQHVYLQRCPPAQYNSTSESIP